MKIATYNVNGINGRLPVLLRWLEAAQPDVVCLQELKAPQEKFPESALLNAGYHSIWHGEKSWNGVAILVKGNPPLETMRGLPGDKDDLHSRYIEAEVDCITIGCIYLPNGNPAPGPKFDYKLRWFERLTSYAKTLLDRGTPVVLAGDYNVIPTDLDCHKPERWVTDALFFPESREAYRNLVAQGWTDALRELYPDEKIFTYWDYFRNAYSRDAGIRIDHLLLSPQLSGSLRAAGVDREVRGWEKSSDHAPTWIEITNIPLNSREEPMSQTTSAPEDEMPSDLQRTAVSAGSQPIPISVKPMLATLVDKPFNDDGWSYEIKWDGYRAIAFMEGGHVDFKSRNDKSFNEKFYSVFAALKAWEINAVVDGEVVVIDNKGVSNFGSLQNWRSEADGTLIYYAFDLLWLDGKDLTNLPLDERRMMLRNLIPKSNEIIRLSDDVTGSGVEIFEAAKKLGLEGIVAKKKDSSYSPGERSREWLKIKVHKRQEVVIGGYTKNEGSNKPFSSLLVGVFDGDQLGYTGKIGTGFSVKTQQEMLTQFQPLIRSNSPFSTTPDINSPSRFRPDPPRAEATWLEPKLVCEVSFAEMTSDGVMRHPSFEGMRIDKNAGQVVLEQEEDVSTLTEPLTSPSVPTSRKTLLNPNDETQVRNVDGHDLKLTNLGKLYWPEDHITKRDMLNYYYQAAPYILPYLKNRPQSLNRHPNGIHGKQFYQKDVKGKVPEWVHTFSYYSDADEREKEFFVCDDEASLLYLASLGCIEISPWSSSADKPNMPDWCVIDLDPDQNSFDEVIDAAQVIHELLKLLNVPAYCKTSGSSGLHIYIPLGEKYTYEQSKEFARALVTVVHGELPQFTSIERRVADRDGKMYLDFLQNRPQATIAAPYCLRPKPGAPVSMPLRWEEVKQGLRMSDFTIVNAIDRLAQLGDIFKPVLGEGIDLEGAMKRLNSKSV